MEMPYRFPRCEAAVTVPANGWALLWADGDTEDGANHLPFTLNAADTMYLFTKGALQVDSLGWDSSLADVSFGREQDGSMSFVSFEESTPEASNDNGVILSVLNTSVENALSVYPNPVSTGVVNFNKVVSIRVFSISGQLMVTRDNVNSLSVADFDKGMYIIETNDGDVVKMIVE
jgi:hypothetical protein